MIDLQFPDGATRAFAEGSTGLDVAKAISPSLAKKAVLVKLDGELRDLERPLERSGRIEIVTRDSPEALETIRHDTAHVLAEAVQELFPGTQVTIGPSIEDGFYYDFARDEPFSIEDFARIEAKMREIVDRGEPIRREVWDREEAIRHFEVDRRKVQGRDHPRPARGRDDHRLQPGPLEGPLPRPAPAHDQARGQGVQADQARRRLLAGRSPQRPAPAHVRHGLGQ